MNPLINSTPHQDLRDWRKEDLRVRCFKEKQWQRTDNHNPIIALVFVMITGALLAISLIYFTSLIVVK